MIIFAEIQKLFDIQKKKKKKKKNWYKKNRILDIKKTNSWYQ